MYKENSVLFFTKEKMLTLAQMGEGKGGGCAPVAHWISSEDPQMFNEVLSVLMLCAPVFIFICPAAQLF